MKDRSKKKKKCECLINVFKSGRTVSYEENKAIGGFFEILLKLAKLINAH